MNKESIKHAAVKTECGLILLGKSHADCIHKGYHAGIKTAAAAEAQGFMTSKGRFVDREEAFNIALGAGQISEPFGNVGVGVLFSEDLWSAHSGGQHDYDYVKGYVGKVSSPPIEPEINEKMKEAANEHECNHFGRESSYLEGAHYGYQLAQEEYASRPACDAPCTIIFNNMVAEKTAQIELLQNNLMILKNTSEGLLRENRKLAEDRTRLDHWIAYRHLSFRQDENGKFCFGRGIETFSDPRDAIDASVDVNGMVPPGTAPECDWHDDRPGKQCDC